MKDLDLEHNERSAGVRRELSRARDERSFSRRSKEFGLYSFVHKHGKDTRLSKIPHRTSRERLDGEEVQGCSFRDIFR